MAQPLISLITVCYNAEHVLEKTLLSAVQQSFQDFELVIIDGGSTDQTLNIANRFSQKIGHLVSEKDAGIYDAMNKGIKASKGEWLYFLNAGDAFYTSTVLAELFAEKDLAQTWFLYGKVQTVNEPTGVDYITGKSVTLGDFYTHYPICHQATFTHRKAFEAVGLFHTSYKLAADTEWFLRFFLKHEEQATFVDQTIAFYDIQGSTYQKRMAGYREYLRFGWVYFPAYIALKNTLMYPLVWLKVKLIRLLTGTAFFRWYRNIKFTNSRAIN